MKSSKLSSDILEQQFGPTELIILYQNGLTRIICTKVLSSGQVLELSLVKFIQSGIDKFPDVHQAIVAGQSMGKAFRAQGIDFRRQVNSVRRSSLPENLSRRFGSNDLATVVAVSIRVGPDRSPYAHILEVYSPAVAWPYLNNGPNDEQLKAIQSFSQSLQELKL